MRLHGSSLYVYRRAKIGVDIYGHLTPGGNKGAVDRLDDLDAKATIRNQKGKGANRVRLTP
jgi:hypothetical protein